MTSVIPFDKTIEAEPDGSDFDQRPQYRKSQRRGWRAGLASHTVIENFEDAKFYRSFERSIVGSFGPRTIIELELIHRLASLLWRLRRASAIETGLFGMQDGQPTGRPPAPAPTKANGAHRNRSANSAMAQRFMGLCRVDPALLERLGAYEMRLWRQAAQTIWLLDAIRRPPPVARQPHRRLVPHRLWDSATRMG